MLLHYLVVIVGKYAVPSFACFVFVPWAMNFVRRAAVGKRRNFALLVLSTGTVMIKLSDLGPGEVDWRFTV